MARVNTKQIDQRIEKAKNWNVGIGGQSFYDMNKRDTDINILNIHYFDCSSYVSWLLWGDRAHSKTTIGLAGWDATTGKNIPEQSAIYQWDIGYYYLDITKITQFKKYDILVANVGDGLDDRGHTAMVCKAGNKYTGMVSHAGHNPGIQVPISEEDNNIARSIGQPKPWNCLWRLKNGIFIYNYYKPKN